MGCKDVYLDAIAAHHHLRAPDVPVAQLLPRHYLGGVSEIL